MPAIALLKADMRTHKHRQEPEITVTKRDSSFIGSSIWIKAKRHKTHPFSMVVFVNVSPAARTADRVTSRLQQFWLDAVNPLMLILEKAEKQQDIIYRGTVEEQPSGCSLVCTDYIYFLGTGA